MFEKIKFNRKLNSVLRSWEMPVSELELVDRLAASIIIHIMDAKKHFTILNNNYVCADSAILSAIYACKIAEQLNLYDSIARGLLKRVYMSCINIFHISIDDLHNISRNRLHAFEKPIFSAASLESVSGEASFLFIYDIEYNKFMEFAENSPLPAIGFDKQFQIQAETKILLRSLGRLIDNTF